MSHRLSRYATNDINAALAHPLFRGEWSEELLAFYYRMGWTEAARRAEKEGKR